MADPKGNVNSHIVSTLLNRRNGLKAERRQLKKAAERLAEIEGELDIIGQELTDRGHVDPPPPEE
jgi:hypothetical protein